MPTKPVKDIDGGEAKELYRKEYFDKPGFSKLPANVASVLFDYGVNAGTPRATMSLQKAVGASPDGVIGPKTLNKVNEFVSKNGEQPLLQSIVDQRAKHNDMLIKKNPAKYKKFENGWKNRIKAIKSEFKLSDLNPFAVTEASADEVPQNDFTDLGFEEAATPTETFDDLGFQPEQDIAQLSASKNFDKSVPLPEKMEATPADFDFFTQNLADKLATASSGQTVPEMIESKNKLSGIIMRAPMLAMAPVAPIASAVVEGLNQAKNIIVSSVKNEKYSPIEIRVLNELLPKETPTAVRIAAMGGEALTDVALLGGLSNLAKQGLLKDTIKEIGMKLERAGYGTGQKTINMDVVKEAARGSTLDLEAERWLKAKLGDVKPKNNIGTTTPEKPVAGIAEPTVAPKTDQQRTVDVNQPEIIKAPPPSKEILAEAQKPTTPVERAAQHGEVVGIDAKSGLPVIDTSVKPSVKTDTYIGQDRRSSDMIPQPSTPKNRLSDWTPILDAYDTAEGKKYQINKLDVSDTIKGKLLDHYGLLFDKPVEAAQTTTPNLTPKQTEALAPSTEDITTSAKGETVYRGTIGYGEIESIKNGTAKYDDSRGGFWTADIKDAEGYAKGRSLNIGSNTRKPVGEGSFILRGKRIGDGSIIPMDVIDIKTGKVIEEFTNLKGGDLYGKSQEAGQKGNEEKVLIPQGQKVETPKAPVSPLHAEALKYKTAEEFNDAILENNPKQYKTMDESASVTQRTAFDYLKSIHSEAHGIKADAGKGSNEGVISDFGEKIGGARKDTAEKGFTKSTVKKPETSQHAWKNKYIAAEKVNKSGWTIIRKDTPSYMIMSDRGQVFATQEEAEKAIPIRAVADAHRVYQNKNKKWEIFKRVGERKLFKVVNKEFDEREEAMKHMALHAEEILNLKTNFGEEILPVPEIATRKGVERRTKNADAKMFMETFAPRGIEFGNWNNQEERQQVLNHAYDGLLDLADVLGISPKDLMLSGELGVAFGARGQGLSGAKAHYERDYGVINLTKMKGAGSLAHEWFHALDNYLARVDGKAKSTRIKNSRGDLIFPTSKSAYLSEGASYQSKLDKEFLDAYKKLIDTMFRKAEQYVENTEVADKFVARARDEVKNKLDKIRDHLAKPYEYARIEKFKKPASAEKLAEFDKLANTIIEGGNLETKFREIPGVKNMFKGRNTNDALESISAILKSVRNRTGFGSYEQPGTLDDLRSLMSLYKTRLQMFKEAEGKIEKIKTVPTDYAIEARKMDQARTGDYWSEPTEMAARAFSAYVEDKVGLPIEKRATVIDSATGERVPMAQSRYQMPKEIYERYKMWRGLIDEATTAVRIVNDLNRYWRINILAHPGTSVTNFVSGGIQFSSKILTDFYREVLTGKLSMPETRSNISAMLKVLLPKGWMAAPDWVYGSDLSNFYGEFMKKKSPISESIDTYGNKALVLFGAVERYWKKVIMTADGVADLKSLNEMTPEGLRVPTKEEAEMIAAINESVDLYGYDYDNVPQWLEQHQKSMIGQAIKPFAKYPYKYAKQILNMVGGAFDQSIPVKDRMAKILALATIVSAYAAFANERRKKQKTPVADKSLDIPARLQTRGRVLITTDEKGREIFVRVAKYPFLNLTEAGMQFVDGNWQTGTDVLSDMLGSIGPAASVGLMAFNYRSKYTQYEKPEVILGDNLATFLPGYRILNDVSRALDPFQRKQETLGQTFTQIIPTTDAALQERLHGKIRTERVPIEGNVGLEPVGSRTTVDVPLENVKEDILLSLFTGVYRTRLDPKVVEAYIIRKQKNLDKKNAKK